jgi:two-component system OmpR family response regulator
MPWAAWKRASLEPRAASRGISPLQAGVRAVRGHSCWPGCAQPLHRFGRHAIAVRCAAASTTEAPTRVLVVDDELNITELVSLGLRYEGFDVSSAHDGRGALRAVREFKPELMILDVTMPDIDGLEVVRRMRAENIWTPVMFLTARDATEDKIAGLTVGGDDYLTKPFSLDELIARVRAMVRRNNLAVRRASSGVLQYADLLLDEDRLEVARGPRQISLTPTEFRLLRFLMLNAGRVVSKTQILDHVWEYDFGGDGNVVETFISYLRKKVDVAEPPLIQTVRGFGYTLRLTRG